MTFTLTNTLPFLPTDSISDTDGSDSSDINPSTLLQIHLPTPLIVIALTSIIPLFLNIIYLVCWFKYPSIRRTLGDIFCFLSLLFSLKDLSELALGIISMAVPADSEKLNLFLCQWTTHTNLININFVYCYSIALTIHLAQVTRGSGLDTGQKSIWYHLSIWLCALAAYLATFFLGSLEQDIFGRCMHSIGPWNYVLPGIFTCSLIYSLYTYIRVHRREGLLKQLRTIRFLRSFKVYMLLSCLFIVEEIILLVFDTRLHFDNTKAFYNVTVPEQVTIVVGYAFGILFTYSVFIMRYIDPYVKSKIRLLLRLAKPDPTEDLSLPLVINDELRISAIIPRRKLSPIYRRTSEAVRSVDVDTVPTEVQVQEDLKKGYIGSIVVGIAYLVAKLEGIVSKLDPEELDAVNVRFEKMEKLYIGEEQLQQGCHELYDMVDRMRILIYEGYLSVPSINLLIKMLGRDKEMLGELKKSFGIQRNADGLRQGLRQEARSLFFYTFDKRFLVKLIRENKAQAFKKFTMDLFMYQQEVNKESCIENVVGTFKFSPGDEIELVRHFILIRNRFQDNNTSLEEAIELKGQDVRSMGERSYVEKIKGLVRQASEVQTKKEAIIKDIEFLSKCGLYDYSLIFSLYRPCSEWTLDMKNEDNEEEVENVERANSTVRLGKFSIGNLLKIKHNGQRKKPREYEKRMKAIVEVLFGKYMAPSPR